MGVGAAIQNARKKAGLTQEQLAGKVYVTRATSPVRRSGKVMK